MKLKIDPEFKALMPELSKEEYRGLDSSLQLEGCLSPIVVWKGQGIILDGHNRYEICCRHRIKFEVKEVSLPNRDVAIEWIVTNQLGRRNLTAEQRSYYRGKEYLVTKKAEGRPAETAEKPILRQNDGVSGTTAEQVAAKHHVSPRTVERDAEFAEAVDKLPPKERAAVLDGTSDKTKSDIVAAAKPDPVPPPAKEPKPDKPLKPGQVHFDKAKFESAYGQLFRQVDEIGRPYSTNNTPTANAFRDRLAEWKNEVIAWQKSLAKGQR